jgi:hypothetical protein
MANVNKSKKYHFIYKTTNLLNSKYYIGMHSTSNLKDGYLGSGKKLRYSIHKYGIANFKLKILEFLESRDELVKRERELVNEDILKDPMCMNLKIGGDGGPGSRFLTKEQLQKGGTNALKKIWKNDKYRENKIKKLSEQLTEFWANGKFFYRDNWTGRKHRSETIEKMKQKKRGTGMGSSNSQFGTCWITNEIENKKINKGDIIPDGWRLGRKTFRYKIQ